MTDMGYGDAPIDQPTAMRPGMGRQSKGPALAGRKLFTKKNPGSPGKLGKTSTRAEALSKLRGKGALA